MKYVPQMPRSVKVMGQRFTIEKYAHINEEIDGHNFNLLGHADSDEQKIRLTTDGIGDDRKREVFLHENLHAMVNVAGLPRDILIDDKDEAAIKRLAPILLLWLRDNPRAVAYLMESNRL